MIILNTVLQEILRKVEFFMKFQVNNLGVDHEDQPRGRHLNGWPLTVCYHF